MSHDLTARDAPVDVLVAHQRHGDGCLCGWHVLGASHCQHQIEALAADGYTIVTTDSAPAGICGDRAPTLPDQLIVCTLPAGHAGWHGNGRGTDWTGEVVPDAR